LPTTRPESSRPLWKRNIWRPGIWQRRAETLLWCGTILWRQRRGEELQLNACGIRLIQRDGITTTDLATLHYGGVDPNVSPVVLGCCMQDTGILWEVALRECCHDAARTEASDAETNGIPNREQCPIQAFSTKSLSPLAVSTTMFG
jgi:hypothetical protein